MIPKKIYLNYVDEDDEDKIWSEDPISVSDCEIKNREYTDLRQVWHDASEEPRYNELLLGLDCEGINFHKWFNIKNISWEYFVDNIALTKWAYIDDLLPKGGIE